MEIYFAMAIRMLLLYMKPLFLSVFQFFSVNRKRIVLLTLFCLLKNRNNGNFTVPIHKIPVMALLIIRIINFRFRFKCGTAATSSSVGPEKLNNRMTRKHSGSHAIAWAAISTFFHTQVFSGPTLEDVAAVPRFSYK